MPRQSMERPYFSSSSSSSGFSGFPRMFFSLPGMDADERPSLRSPFDQVRALRCVRSLLGVHWLHDGLLHSLLDGVMSFSTDKRLCALQWQGMSSGRQVPVLVMDDGTLTSEDEDFDLDQYFINEDEEREVRVCSLLIASA